MHKESLLVGPLVLRSALVCITAHSLVLLVLLRVMFGPCISFWPWHQLSRSRPLPCDCSAAVSLAEQTLPCCCSFLMSCCKICCCSHVLLVA